MNKLPNFTAYASRTEALVTAQHLVRFFYYALLFVSLLLFVGWWDSASASQGSISPFWPTSWIVYVDQTFAVYFIRLLFITGALLASVMPEKRWARLLAFLGLIQFVSLYMSFWQLDVDWYPWVVAAFLFIFLPDWGQAKANEGDSGAKFLLVFWAAQAGLLLGYFMGAFGKILHSVTPLINGQTHSFSIDAAALHIADRLLTTNSTSLLGPLVIEQPWLGWPVFLAAIYLMFFSYYVLFELALQRWWAIGLICYHVAAYLTMNIGFTMSVLLITILLLKPPFEDTKLSVREKLAKLPVFGPLYQKLAKFG